MSPQFLFAVDLGLLVAAAAVVPWVGYLLWRWNKKRHQAELAKALVPPSVDRPRREGQLPAQRRGEPIGRPCRSVVPELDDVDPVDGQHDRNTREMPEIDGGTK